MPCLADEVQMDAHISDLFLFPDENGLGGFVEPQLILRLPPRSELCPSLPPENAAPDYTPDDGEFCILEAPGMGIPAKDGEPVVKQLVDGAIVVNEDHFYRPLSRSDLLRPPPHFPIPEACYTLREVSIVCHLYGGRDFTPTSTFAAPLHGAKYSSGTSPRVLPHRLPSSGAGTRSSRSNWQTQGGPGRNQDVLMEIQLKQALDYQKAVVMFYKFLVRFQHEVYSPVLAMTDQPVSRQVFIVQDVEVRDRLASSQINKFLYLYTSERMPRKTYANMVGMFQCFQLKYMEKSGRHRPPIKREF
uniref:autophagy-related protein 2 homolog A-like n=1 Tax=Myxine glutinosa TaxID=7769 RepID=UPI00358DE779